MFINGEKTEINTPLTVEQLLKTLCHDTQRVAVEKNGVIVPKTAFASETAADGDKIEIVTFVGGG
jgi:sulfur carrier protein